MSGPQCAQVRPHSAAIFSGTGTENGGCASVFRHAALYAAAHLRPELGDLTPMVSAVAARSRYPLPPTRIMVFIVTLSATSLRAYLPSRFAVHLLTSLISTACMCIAMPVLKRAYAPTAERWYCWMRWSYGRWATCS
eukprot:256564-Rhodomonas_salina.2